MKEITVKAVRSDVLYRQIAEAPIEKKDDIYRYDFMKLFEKKFDAYHIPMKAKTAGGYDIIMASGMLGYLLPQHIDESTMPVIQLLDDDDFWNKCSKSIENSLQKFVDAGIELKFKEYLYTMTLANPESPYAKLCDNYSGDGGIPGYIFGTLVPSDFTKRRMPVALAHETNHNVRFQFIKWSNDISLGEYMVCEGLAENYAAYMYGESEIGAWVTKTDMETLNEYIKPIMKDSLLVNGFNDITAYMYGDELASLQHYNLAGMPYCAGYACGYHMVKYYLNKTGKSIIDATILPAEEILKELDGFWEEETVF